MTINDRFKQIIDSEYKGNKRAFALAVGVSPTVIENVVGSRQGKPSYDVIYKICANANISETWLISGLGSMLKGQNSIEHSTKTNTIPVVETANDNESLHHDSYNTLTRPRIPFEAAAGGLSIALNGVSESECEQMPVIASLPRYDFTIIARGNSMQPDILSGDEIACAFVQNSTFIQWGQTHVLDTAQGVVVKRIFDDHDMIVCKSNNPDFPDFTIPKNEIYHMAIVVGLIRHF